MPPLRTADGHHLEPRRVSWVELFFDLVFAGAVNQLAGTLQNHPNLTTLAHFALFFVPVWWLWVQFSFYADRHESDDASHRCVFLVAIVLGADLAASAAGAVPGDPAGFVIAFAAMRGLQLLLYARARRHLPATRALYGRYLICFGAGGALWLVSPAVSNPLRYAVWAAALAADAAGPLGMLASRRRVPLNAWHLAERFQLFVLIVLGESVARLISAAALRPWSVPLAVVLAAAVVTLAALWWAWIRSADHTALDSTPTITWFAAANLPIVAGIAAASAGLHVAILAADGAATIGIGPRAALYGGVSVCLLASAVLPPGTLAGPARAARLATSAAAMGLVFMGAIVLPVYLVPALTAVLALGLAAETHPALTGRYLRWPARRPAPKPGRAAGRAEAYRSQTGTA
ncbi:MAG: low temperature requirement protein A [Actinobacteria bacterium]|nr:low temperature requirement protein A [Actinomycetota bacterium]